MYRVYCLSIHVYFITSKKINKKMRNAHSQMENNLLVPKPSRAWHNLTYQHLTTLKLGELTPVGIIETVPGGKYIVGCESVVRFQPLVSPVMHRMDIKIHNFFVPIRTLWDGFEHFIQGKPDVITGVAPVPPYFLRSLLTRNTVTGTCNPPLADHFGFRFGDLADFDHNLNPLMFSAYQHIYNNYYRHKAVTPEVRYKCIDGNNVSIIDELTPIRKITYEDDYFNLSLPSPQLGSSVFVDTDAAIMSQKAGTNIQSRIPGVATYENTVVPNAVPNPNDGVPADGLFARTRILMEEIRRAARLQEFTEMQRHATTYKDYLQAMFDTNLPDFRAQIPVYINGFSQPIIVSEVTNQSDTFQGRQTGNAGSYSTAEQEEFYAHEHGFIISIAAVTYKPAYIKAQPRHNFKQGRFDYFHPQFDTLGERPLYQGELNGNATYLDKTFGYVPQNSEYRHTFDIITGEMATLNAHWHLARSLQKNPILSSDFFEVNDERRIFAFQNADYSPIILQVLHHINAELPIPSENRPSI
nr:MAG: major capsid protein [Microvirus sp.]